MITVATPTLSECLLRIWELESNRMTLKRVQGLWIATLKIS